MIPEIYITNGIKWDGAGSKTPAHIRGQITQFTGFKLQVPRKNYRSCEFTTNLLNPELEDIYAEDPGFESHHNFVYVRWNEQIVFWGPIITKDMDFENNTMQLSALDQGARLEHHYFRIGDDCMNPADGSDGDITVGHLPVNAFGLEFGLLAGESPSTSLTNSIALAVRLGDDDHTDSGRRIKIERGQEVWRTMLELGDRSDGPLFEFVPLPITDSEVDFAEMRVYGPYFRNDHSATVKFHYLTGLNNVRNLQPVTGGEVLSHVHALTQNNEWRVTTVSHETAHVYGVWVQWEQVDWNLSDGTTEAEAIESLGAVGDAVLDAYGRPLKMVEITLRRDDQVHDSANQFVWIDDFEVGDVVEVQGVKGNETFDGNFQIDEVRLEQEADNSGQVRQVIAVIQHVEVGQYEYDHSALFVDLDDE